MNRYAFERNNPYKYTDPDGHIELLTTVVLINIAIVLLKGYNILYSGQSNYYKNEINQINSIANQNAGTPSGEFNREYESVLQKQNSLTDKLSLHITSAFKDEYISEKEKDYIKNTIQPLVSNLEVDVNEIPTTSSEILELLEKEHKDFEGDATFQKVKRKFEIYEQSNQQKTDKSKEDSNKNNQGIGGGGSGRGSNVDCQTTCSCNIHGSCTCKTICKPRN